MEYGLELMNLQRIATLSKAISIWESLYVKRRVTDFFNRSQRLIFNIEGSNKRRRYCECGSLTWSTIFKEDWLELTKKVLQQLQQNVLPVSLETQLIHVVREIGAKIYLWYWYIEDKRKKELDISLDFMCQTINYVQKLYWTNFGTVDEIKILELFWLGNPNLQEREICHLARYFTLDDCVNSSLEDLRTMFRYNSYSISPSESVNRFRLFVYSGHITAVKFLWNNINKSEKDANIVKWVVLSIQRYCYLDEKHYINEKYTEICVFLVQKMSVDHRKEFFGSTFVCEFLRMLLSAWPWQELLVPALEKIYECEKEDCHIIYKLVEEIVKKISEDHALGFTKNIYLKLLHEVWNTIPQSIKSEMAHEYDLESICLELLKVQNTSGLKLIINAPELSSTRTELIDSMFNHLIKTDQFEKLDKFMKEILLFEGEAKALKQKINLYEHFINQGEFHMVNKLLDWQSDSEEERTHFKNLINYMHFFSKFLENSDFRLVDKLLIWKFETSDQVKMFKDSFKIKWAQYHLFTLWCTLSSSPEDAKTKSVLFFNWLLDSDEERASFARETVFNNEFQNNFAPYCLREGKFSCLDNFLTWSSLSQEEIMDMKRTLIESLGFKVCGYNFTCGDIIVAQKIVLWACFSFEECKNFINSFMMSVDGIKSCSAYIDRQCRMPNFMNNLEESLRFLINFWIVPLENVNIFREKLHLYKTSCSNIYESRGHTFFQDLLKRLERKD